MTDKTAEAYFDATDIINWFTDNGWTNERIVAACAVVEEFEGMANDIIKAYLESPMVSKEDRGQEH